VNLSADKFLRTHCDSQFLIEIHPVDVDVRIVDEAFAMLIIRCAGVARYQIATARQGAHARRAQNGTNNQRNTSKPQHFITQQPNLNT